MKDIVQLNIDLSDDQLEMIANKKVYLVTDMEGSLTRRNFRCKADGSMHLIVLSYDDDSKPVFNRIVTEPSVEVGLFLLEADNECRSVDVVFKVHKISCMDDDIGEDGYHVICYLKVEEKRTWRDKVTPYLYGICWGFGLVGLIQIVLYHAIG